MIIVPMPVLLSPISTEEALLAGETTVIYPKDTLIETLTTDESGNAVSSELYLGKYRVVEKKAPTDLTIGKEEAKQQKSRIDLCWTGSRILGSRGILL